MPFTDLPPDPLAPARAAFIAPETRWYVSPGPFTLEPGGRLERLQVAYRTWGKLSPAGDNAVVICHAFTGSADADRWWGRMFGPGRALDPERDFIVCSNILGSCYGTTGPASVDPATGRPYLGTFPAFTVRDMVRVQGELALALGVKKIRSVIGGSLGGMQVLEWALLYPEMVRSIVPIANSARHSAWAIGLSEAQRQAIAADPRWAGGLYDPADPPRAGLAAARMMAMCTYRGWESFEERYGRRPQSADLFAMESYLRYQGQQIVDRFDAATYVALTRAMDTHDVARGRGDYEEVLRAIRQPALVVTVGTDVLYVPEEQRVMARHMPAARLEELESLHGHDAFLIHVEELSAMVSSFRDRVEGRAASRPASRASSRRQRVNLLVLGKGKVGTPFLEQIRDQAGSLGSDYDISLRVAGVGDSRGMILDDGGLDLSRWQEDLASAPATGPFRMPSAGAVLDRIARLPGSGVLIDLTADPALLPVYVEAFRRGIHVVGANKHPLAAPTAERDRLSAARREAHAHFHYETSVGASLPILGTLKNLVRTGDRVLRVEGSLSGTAGFLLAEAEKGTPLSLALRWARELGYTEEDPRDDLTGVDSARKAVILARELGMRLDLEDVELTPLVPGEAIPTGGTDLVESLRRLDRDFGARVQEVRSRGRVLRYLVHVDVDAGRVRVGPEELPPDHRAAGLRDVEAYVAATTARRSGSPLLVQGSGVGGALTAGGVITDLLRIAAALGPRTGWSG